MTTLADLQPRPCSCKDCSCMLCDDAGMVPVGVLFSDGRRGYVMEASDNAWRGQGEDSPQYGYVLVGAFDSDPVRVHFSTLTVEVEASQSAPL